MAVFVYQQTASPFLVALLTMLRLLPMSLFGAFLGAAADWLERHLALIVMVLAQLTTSLVLLLLAYADRLEVWHLAVASFLNGIGWTADNPVRRVMIGEAVGVEAMGTASSGPTTRAGCWARPLAAFFSPGLGWSASSL